MRLLLIVLVVLVLPACGTTSSVKLAINAPGITSFQFLDDRALEKRQSYIKHGSSGETHVFGDDAISPSPPDILRAVLQERLGKVLEGKIISLSQFDVSVSDPYVSVDEQTLKASSASIDNKGQARPISAGLIYGIESAKSLKTVTIEVRGTLNGVEFYSLVLDEYRGRVSESDIQESMSRLLDKVAQKIQRIALTGG